MKNMKLIIFILLIIITPLKIKAATPVVGCKYKTKLDTSGNISFTIIVNDDNSISYDGRKDGQTYTDNGVQHAWKFFEMNKFSERMYKDGVIAADCPTLLSAVEVTTFPNRANIYYDRSKTDITTGSVSYFDNLSGTIIKYSSDTPQKEDNSKKYCTKPKKLSGSKTYLNFYFFEDANGVKSFSVYPANDPTNKSTGKYDDALTLTVGGSTYSITLDPNWDNISSFYAGVNECRSSKIYLYGDHSSFRITANEEEGEQSPVANINTNEDGEEYVPPTGSVTDPYPGFPSLETGTNFDCHTVFLNGDGSETELRKILDNVYKIIRIAAPVLAIALSTIDYIKAVADTKAFGKANKRTIIRVAIAIAIMLLPTILDLLFNLFGLYDLSRCEIG